jgi:HK97 family phage portal protein
LLGLPPSGAKSGPLTHPEQIWLEVYGGRASNSGISVNWTTAIQCMAVLACIRVLAEGIAQLPLKLYRETADGLGKEVARDHRLHRLLHRRPNDVQTSFGFRETLMLHAALTGNGYAFKNMIGGNVVELLPLLPNWMTKLKQSAWDYEWEIRFPDKAPMVVPKSSVFHLHGPSWDGLLGMDAVMLARDAIGLALASERNVATLQGKAARPPGVLSTEQVLGAEQTQRVRESWNEAFGGENQNQIAVLEGGFKFTPMGMTAVDAQTQETRRMQIEEICRGFRVFPLMVMQADKTATFASAEQFFLAHRIHTLGPWIERWEQDIDVQLLSDEEREAGLFAKMTVQGLLRGDAKTRADYYSRGILDGWMTRNEARMLEDLNPLEGLDEPLRPLNMGMGSTTQPSEVSRERDNPDDDDEGDDGQN